MLTLIGTSSFAALMKGLKSPQTTPYHINGGATVNAALALTPAEVFTVTGALPPGNADGTTTVIVESAHLSVTTTASTSLNFTMLDPCFEPKPVPVMIRSDPGAPDGAERFLITGAAAFTDLTGGSVVTLNEAALLVPVDVVTVTVVLPTFALAGTAVDIVVSVALVTIAAMSPNLTASPAALLSKFFPLIVNREPTCPETADKLVIAGFVEPGSGDA